MKSIEEAMLKVRLGGERKRKDVEEEQPVVQSKEELFTLNIRCEEKKKQAWISCLLLFFIL